MNALAPATYRFSDFGANSEAFSGVAAGAGAAAERGFLVDPFNVPYCSYRIPEPGMPTDLRVRPDECTL